MKNVHDELHYRAKTLSQMAADNDDDDDDGFLFVFVFVCQDAMMVMMMCFLFLFVFLVCQGTDNGRKTAIGTMQVDRFI